MSSSNAVPVRDVIDPDAAAIMSRAVSWLVLHQPWFAALALRLRMAQTDAIPTAAVDGVTLYYSPDFVKPLSKSHVRGLVAHEVMHCALRHMTRRGTRDPKVWNYAADYVINLQLVAAGFELPAGALLDVAFADMSTEQAYAKLMQQAQPPEFGPDVLGEVMDAPKGSGKESKEGQKGNLPSGGAGGASDNGPAGDMTTPDELEAEWDKAVEQATMMASKAGKLPGGMARTVAAARSESNWRQVVEQYFTVRDDYSWSRPNRRFVGAGIYLPGTAVSRVRHILIAVDTSGSVSPAMLAAFSAECAQIMATAGRPELTTVVYCDARINRVDEYHAADCDDFALAAVGGGGTAFDPVFAHVAALPEPPDVVFYLTDLDSYDRPTDPGCPVVWVTPEWVTLDGSDRFGFGDTVRVNVGN